MSKFPIGELVSEGQKSELVKLLIENTPVAYIILDEDYRVRYINENFLKLRKLERSRVEGEICYNISNGGKPCPHCTVAESWKSGKREFTLRRDVLPDGAVRYIGDYAIPLAKENPADPNYILEIMVDRTKEMLVRDQRDQDFDDILFLFSGLLEAKDVYTATHSQNVRTLAHNLATAMNCSREEIFEISIAASLHDIGKVQIPEKIINKPGKLTDEEFAIIKRHPVASYEMIKDLSSFDRVKDIALHHHERYDGKGYPDGLAGNEISKASRMVTIADAYEAMTSTRSYRKALTHEYAIGELKRMAGIQFDPEMVEIFETLDFDHFDSPIASKASIKQTSSVDRSIIAQVQTENSEPSNNKEGGAEASGSGVNKAKLNLDFLLQEIFDNTPCGYVLMDTSRDVLFASKYFLSFMGLTEEEVIGRKCFQAGCMTSEPCSPCAIEAALKSGKVEHMRQVQDTRNGRKTFDLYGMPLVNADGSVDYVIEVIIDRTAEVFLEKARNRDFKKLIMMLSQLPELQNIGSEEPQLADSIALLKTKIEAILSSDNIALNKNSC